MVFVQASCVVWRPGSLTWCFRGIPFRFRIRVTCGLVPLYCSVRAYHRLVPMYLANTKHLFSLYFHVWLPFCVLFFFFFFFARFFWFMYVFFSPFKCECPGGVGVAFRINMSWFCLGTVRVLVDSFFFFLFCFFIFFSFFLLYMKLLLCVCVCFMFFIDKRVSLSWYLSRPAALFGGVLKMASPVFISPCVFPC